MKINFFDSPTNTINILKQRKSELHFDYDEIMHEAHLRAFTVAKITKLDLLDDIKQSLEIALKNGQGFKEWSESLKPTLAKKGWLGNVSVTNPKTGEVKEIYVGAKRLKRIYETNMRVSYAKSRYESQMNATGEYFRYIAVLDNKTRPAHAKLHGLILPKTHKFWDKNYPPNDWGCRCEVQVLNEFEIKSKGYHVTNIKTLPNIATADWAYSFKDESQNLQDLLIKKGGGADDFKAIKIKAWQRGLDDMLNAVLSGNIIKNKAYQIAQIGEVKPNIKDTLAKQGVALKASSIAIYQNTISHIMRDTKPKNKKPNVAEIRGVVGVFDEAKHVFYDTKDKNLLFFYGSLQDDNMVNYAVIHLNYTLKKFKTDNFVATITKIPFKNLKTMLKQTDKNGSNIYIKVK